MNAVAMRHLKPNGSARPREPGHLVDDIHGSNAGLVPKAVAAAVMESKVHMRPPGPTLRGVNSTSLMSAPFSFAVASRALISITPMRPHEPGQHVSDAQNSNAGLISSVANGHLNPKNAVRLRGPGQEENDARDAFAGLMISSLASVTPAGDGSGEQGTDASVLVRRTRQCLCRRRHTNAVAKKILRSITRMRPRPRLIADDTHVSHAGATFPIAFASSVLKPESAVRPREPDRGDGDIH